MQAVIHLAAIPHPAGASGPEIFRTNSSGTFNVYEAAAQEGIRRVVSASSINALGFNYGIKSFPIEYLPVDEDHPTFTTDPYSFSKRITEEIGAYYWRREGISGVQLRLPWVVVLTEEFRQMLQQFESVLRTASARILEMPAADRRVRASQLVADLDSERASRFHEKPHNHETEGDWQPDLDDPLKLISFGMTDFWAVISADNAAHAFELGATADYEGSHPLFAADAVNMTGMDAEILADAFYPDAARKRPLVGAEPLVSCDKARQLIAYQPASSLADWLQNA
jgi:nucleoside-diphosphate-sugar epimerase